ncbi:hypothetical protein ACET3Z_010187 [Daucus carota]
MATSTTNLEELYARLALEDEDDGGVIISGKEDCGIVYANPEKDIMRAYGVWLRAPAKGVKNQNVGARWLRNEGEGSQTWNREASMQGGDRVVARFMEVDGKIGEVSGDDGGIRIVQRDQGDISGDNGTLKQKDIIMGGKIFENETVIVELKRRRVDNAEITESEGEDITDGPTTSDGPKNLREAGPVVQARLDQ